jgi:hypothetical protein
VWANPTDPHVTKLTCVIFLTHDLPRVYFRVRVCFVLFEEKQQSDQIGRFFCLLDDYLLVKNTEVVSPNFGSLFAPVQCTHELILT